MVDVNEEAYGKDNAVRKYWRGEQYHLLRWKIKAGLLCCSPQSALWGAAGVQGPIGTNRDVLLTCPTLATAVGSDSDALCSTRRRALIKTD